MNKKINFVIILKILSSIFINCATSSNILGLFPHPGYSHFKVFYPILKGLAEKGHNVTVVTYVKSKVSIKNYHEIIISDDENTIHIFEFKDFIPSRSFMAMFNEFFALESEGKRGCNVLYESNAIKEILLIDKENPYDLVIMENFNTDCYLGIPYLLNVPIIGLSSCALMPWHYDRIGLPDTPSFIPSEFVGFSESMTFRERIINFIVTKGVALLYRLRRNFDNKIINEKLHIDIDVREIAKKTSLILVNQHYSLSGARPLSTRLIEIGGIHIQDDTNENLSEDIIKFLNNSKNGVIFISWGSMIKASSLGTDKVNEIINSLEQLPENIIWKWENENVPTKSDKFMFIKWAPQKELLCHPKVKIFWYHGGLLGVSESVYCGKPCVITPVYGDQFLNGRAVENRNMGIILTYENLFQEYILETFKKISKSKYLKNANYVSNVYRNRQNSPLETALWWIEHVIDTNGSNLSYSPSVELNTFVYYSLDVIMFLILLFVCLFSLILKYCSKKSSKKRKSKIK